MAWTFNSPPVSDLHKLRVAVGDVTVNDGPAPDRSNLSDELLTYFLDAGNSIAGAAALAFDHLATLWISRPIFGPGELSTIHTNLYEKFRKAADDWRARATTGSDLGSGTVVTVGSFTRVDGFSDDGSEYT